MTGKTILVLGAGIGGLVTANSIRNRIGKEHKIIIIDSSREHVAYSSLLWVMVGKRKREDIKKDISRLVEDGVEFINEEILKIDPAGKIVKTEKTEYAYDYLVISLGAALAPEAVPGLVDAFQNDVYNMYSLDGVEKVQDRIKNFSNGNIVVLVCSLPFKCPAAPYEAAFLMKDFFRKKGLDKNVKVKLFTPEVLPMAVAGPAVGIMLKEMLEKTSIEYFFEHKSVAINADAKKITFDKGEADYDVLVVVPPHRAPQAVVESGLTDNDWIPVEKNTLKTKFDDVYAIGDITKVKIPGEWMQGMPLTLPKAGVFAHYEAKVVAENIANEIQGKKEKVEFTGEGACFIEIGHGMAGFGTGNFYSVPNPTVKMHRPSPIWHWSKILFEKFWLSDSTLKKPMDVILEKIMFGEYKIKK